MFATLLGAYPASSGSVAPETEAGDVVAELAEAGLDLLSDGRGARKVETRADATSIVDAWRFAASATDRAVKQSIVGPYTHGRRATRDAVMAAAERAEMIQVVIADLAAAGCPLVEIEEPDAVLIGEEAAERRRFTDAHRRLTASLDGSVHLSLVLTGGNVDTAGAGTFFDLPYASYAFDLIAGPDNWRLIAQAPRDRGIICGALDPAPDAGDGPELLVWAAHYAASTGGRGLARVGLANAPGLEELGRDRARLKMRALGEAARIASVEAPGGLAAMLDPRSIDIRSAAAGRYVPRSGARGRRAR